MNRPARVLFVRPKPQKKERRVFSPTPTDEAILIALGRYTYLRIDQLAKLLPNARRERPATTQQRDDGHRYLQQRTKLLLDHGYIGRRYLFPEGPTVKGPGMLWLEAPGIALVRDQLEHIVVAPPKTSEVKAASPSHLRHTLFVTDLLILAELLCHHHPDRFEIDRLMTERELVRQGVPVRLPDGTTSSVKPDGYLRLLDDRGDHYEELACCFELDNGSEYREAWFTKLRRLLAFSAGPYQTWAGTEALVIPVVVTTGPQRVTRLLTLTEEFLMTQKASAFAHLFRFCSLDPVHATPQELFLKPIWFVPFRDDPVPLIAAAPGQITTAPLDRGALQVANGFPAHYLTPQEMGEFLESVDSKRTEDVGGWR